MSRRRRLTPAGPDSSRGEPDRTGFAWLKNSLLPIALVLAVLATYGRIVRHDFVAWDDGGHITENPHLSPVTFASLVRLWRAPYFGHYVPVSYTVFAAEAWLAQSSRDEYGKLQFKPAVFHSVSLILHVVCVLLAYRFLRMILRQPMAAGLGACLFGLHPLQVESVAWISEQRGVLAALFSFVSLMAYVKFSRGLPQPAIEGASGGWGWYALASAAYVLALLAKPSAVSIPLIAAVLDQSLLSRSWRVSAGALLPWLTLAAGMFAITHQEQAKAISFDPQWWFRPLIAGNAIQFYLTKLVWPVGLVIQYPRTTRMVVESGWIYLAWTAPAVVLWLCYHFRRQGPWMACAGWFLAALAPVLGLTSFAFQHFSIVADRYAYLALFAPSLALGWWLARYPTRGPLAGSVMVLAILAALSFRQAGHWRDNKSLFLHTLSLNPRSDVAHFGWAGELADRGRFAEALRHLDEGHRINAQTGTEKFYVNRGRALIGLSRSEEAIEVYQQALRSFPDSIALHQNISAAYFQMQDWESAIHHSQVALLTEPQNVIARFNLALALEKSGAMQEAAEQFAQVLAVWPDHHPSRLKLGMLLSSAGQRDEAKRQFSYILSRKDDPSAHAELAAALLQDGNVTAALQHYQHALELESSFWAAIASRVAWLLATHPSPEVRNGRQAVALAEQACRRTEFKSPELIQSLAAAHAETGDFDQAVALAERASDLALQQGQSQRAMEIQSQLAGFRQKKPYRSPDESPPAAR